MKRSRMILAGLLLVMVVLAACGEAEPQPVAPPPETVAGAWTRTAPEADAAFLLLLPDGEFRVAREASLLFDDPLLIGQYQYDAGWLTLLIRTEEDGACIEPGIYMVTAYDDSGDLPSMTLTASSDDCASRRALFYQTSWTQPAAEG